jgi:hypothetical protein
VVSDPWRNKMGHFISPMVYTISIVFVEPYRIEYIIQYIRIRNTYIDIIDEINRDLVDRLHLYGGM